MVYSIIKKIVFLSFFLFLSFVFPRQIFADTLSVGSCGGCYATIQEAVDASADDDTIYVTPGTYDESVIVNKILTFDTDAESVVNVTKFELRNSASLSGSGTFKSDYVVVRTGGSFPPGGGIGDAIALVKVGGIVDVESKPNEETCLENHWEGGITINKDLTLESNAFALGEDVCLTDSEGTAITVTSGDVTIKNFVLYDSVNGIKVNGGKVTVEEGAIRNNTHGIVTASGTEVNATRIYWGHESGPYSAIHNAQGQANDIGDEVAFCPFYTDQGRTNLDDALCRSSSGSNNNGSPICADQQPGNAPQLFQIDVNATQAILYYTPISNNNSDYYISYSEKSNTYQHGTTTGQGQSNGVLSYTVNFLKLSTTYYFKVRGQNGCMPGDWGNEMKIKTRSKGATVKVFYYKDGSTSVGKTTNTTQFLVKGTQTTATEEITKPIEITPTPTPVPQTNKPTEPKKKCFLWWCW